MNPENITPRLPAFPGSFVMRFSSTRRGARLARLLAVQRLDSWGVPYDSTASGAVAVVVGELAANAVAHGHVPGRDFELRLTLDPVAGTVRVEVSDARGERVPLAPAATARRADARPPESGYGLLLVEELATKWGVEDRDVGKTVWAEYALHSRTTRAYSP